MGKGFFSKYVDEDRRKKVKEKNKQKKDLCENCKLYKTCTSPKMQPTGQGLKKILIIAEAPGKQEDEKGIQLVGQSGKLLRYYLRKYELSLEKDCWKTNAIICRPKKNKTPTTAQINYCRDNLLKTIERLKPEKIITLGGVALQSLIGKKMNDIAIGKFVGWQIPDQEYKCWIFPNYHPAYLLRNPDDIVLHKNFEKYLKEAIDWEEEFPDYSNAKEKITIIKNLDDFKHIRFLKTIAFDYETTGIKPHRESHEIICMSMSDGEKNIVFPIFENENFKKIIKDFLKSDLVKKVAQNLRFEHLWSNKILGTNVENWYWDTMIATHILDNRSGITGLKFQTYVNFGVAGYDNDVKKYLESKEKGANNSNKIKECDMDELLLYCGMDSYFTFELYKKQKKQFEKRPFIKKGFDFFMKGMIELSKIGLNGIRFDEKKYEENFNKLKKDMDKLYNKIQNSREVEKLNLKTNEEFNFNSTKELRYLLFDVLEWDSVKETKTGFKSVDKESLEKFNKPFTNNILQHRYLAKIENTYLSQFKREAVKIKDQYFIYPDFNLNTVSSYRSSSSNPNFQNIPKRDKFARDIIRGCLFPREGRMIVEVDYSGIEVRIGACYHKDKKMMEYIKNPESDMHKDMAVEIFNLPKKQITKDLRYLSKNGFVFPQFYGDYYKQCAKNIWERLTKEQKKIIPFKKYRIFENHMKKVEDGFWNERFYEYNQWRNDIWDFYQKNGYIELKTGFRCGGVMRKNQVTNMPIQGSAFHCLLWSLIKINKLLENYESCIIGQIHDSIVLDIVPRELEELKPIIKKIMCVDIKKEFDWIILPLDIEADITPIDGSWDKQEEIKI